MSEHGIEELERQFQAARDRSKQADIDLKAAADRLQEARNEASGIIGHVLTYSISMGYGSKARKVERRLLVSKVAKAYNGELYAHGRLVIANGTIGLRGDHVPVSKATDAGPYVAPAK